MAGSARRPAAPRARGKAGREKARQSTAAWLPLLTGQRYLASAKLAERLREHVKTEVVRSNRQLRPRPPLVRRHRPDRRGRPGVHADRKSTRLNSSHLGISYAVFCLKKKKK